MHRFTFAFLGAAVLAACKSPEEEVRQAVRGHLNLPSAPDEVIELLEFSPDRAVVRIYTSGAPNTFPIFYLTRPGGAWRVEYELREEFTKTKMSDLAFEKEFLQRMATRMQERFNRAITIKPGIPKTVAFDEANKAVVAKVSALFNASPEPGHVMDFWYCESHRFKDGGWSYDSYTLLERVPAKDERR